MILGFGSTEVETAIEIIRECVEAAQKAPVRGRDEAIKLIQQRYNELADQYKSMSRNEAPERYTTFHFFYSEALIRQIIEFSMIHINRRHPFSPDGWAALTSKWVAIIDFDNEVRIYQQVA